MTNSEAKLDMDLADVVKADKKDELKGKKSPKAKVHPVLNSYRRVGLTGSCH